MANVFIYSLSTCSHCKRAKKFFEENGISYDYVDVDLKEGQERTDTIEEVKKHNPRCTFPTVLIEDEVIVGCREDEFKKVLGI